jgi:hypothetical protein
MKQKTNINAEGGKQELVITRGFGRTQRPNAANRYGSRHEYGT